MSNDKGFPMYEELVSLLGKFKGQLSEAEFREVQHFLEHNELEIAFETLCGIVVENDLELSVFLKSELKRVFEEFERFSDERWEEIELLKHINSIKTNK